mmetsp:Transcript_14968/g.25998  ORF Transcript_14968/g.25998 Transcript_14968/m.25998 type:complete len:269 (-) Transcript_14968:1-807(-)
MLPNQPKTSLCLLPPLVGKLLFGIILPPCPHLVSLSKEIHQRSRRLDILGHIHSVYFDIGSHDVSHLAQGWTFVKGRHANVARVARSFACRVVIQKHLPLLRVDFIQRSRVVDQEWRYWDAAGVSPCPQVVRREDLGQKPKVHGLGWECRQSQITARHIQFEVEENHWTIAHFFHQALHIRQFLCGCAQDNKHTITRADHLYGLLFQPNLLKKVLLKSIAHRTNAHTFHGVLRIATHLYQTVLFYQIRQRKHDGSKSVFHEPLDKIQR